MLGFGNGDDQAIQWTLELRLLAKHHQRMKEYYLNKAVEAAKRGDNASAKIYEEQAIANEKTRILTLKNLHRIEQAKEEHRLAKNMKHTAQVVRKVQKKMNKEKVRKTIVKAVSILSRESEEEQIVTEAMDLALQEGDMDPRMARKTVHKEFEAKLREELEPATELERIREEIDKEANREGA